MIIPGGINFGPFSGELTTDQLTENDVDIVRKVQGIEVTFGSIMDSAAVEYEGERYQPVLHPCGRAHWDQASDLRMLRAQPEGQQGTERQSTHKDGAAPSLQGLQR